METTTTTTFKANQRVDFFKKSESNRLSTKEGSLPETGPRPTAEAVDADFNTTEYSAVLDRDMDLTELIALAATVAGRGSHRAGTFEIQTSEGIVSHATGKNLVKAATKNIVFKTWDELEAEEAA